MSFFKTFQEKVGFTRKEAAAILTLSSILLAGTGIRWLHPREKRETLPEQQQFDYSKNDSAFTEGVRKHAQQPSARVDSAKAQGAGSQKGTRSNVLNINTATKAQLMSLPGIGETYAERIIEYRNQHGEFSSVEGLLNVKGIGKKRLEKLRPFVRVR